MSSNRFATRRDVVLGLLAAVVAGCARDRSADPSTSAAAAPTTPDSPSVGAAGSSITTTTSAPALASAHYVASPEDVWKGDKVQLSDAEWRAKLSPEAYDILRKEGTERAFTGNLVNVHGKGNFRCAACGLLLFRSDAKFDSGTGWPSFYQPANKTNILENEDNSFGGMRTEVKCPRCGGHLGHVFDDGPAPTGLRYCINSPALTFEPDPGSK